MPPRPKKAFPLRIEPELWDALERIAAALRPIAAAIRSIARLALTPT